MFFLFVSQSFTPLLLKVSGFLFTGLGRIKLYCVPLSMHILLISLWRKFIRKICVEKSMKLSGVSFPGISLEDSPAIVGTNILFFSQGDSMKLWDVSFPGVSLEDSPTIVGTNIVFFSKGEDFLFLFFPFFLFLFYSRSCILSTYGLRLRSHK
ncbi:hypothetical protein LXL04_019940 [Taraxacum kok-saghyz]